MNNVAIIYICTGEYIVFWKEFYETYEYYFLNNSNVEYFVFTDAVGEVIYNDSPRVHIIEQEALEWPYSTLMRYHMILGISEKLEEYDYVFFMNANCICVDHISEEEFLPINEGLLVVQHFQYYNCSNDVFSYDRTPESLAYIPEGEGKYYVCGGINGGKSREYLNLCTELKRRIDDDLSRGIIAKYHDESHINRYIYETESYKLLSPAFVYPEGWNMPYSAKIVTREKNKWINTNRIKRSTSEIDDNDYTVVKVSRDVGISMFQYAMAEQLRFMGKNVYLDGDTCVNDDIPVADNTIVRKSKKKDSLIDSILFFRPNHSIVAEDKCKEFFSIYNKSRGYYIGTWQRDMFFYGIRDYIKDKYLRLCQDSINDQQRKIEELIKDNPCTASICIFNSGGALDDIVQSIDYMRMINALCDEAPLFLVFTDNAACVREAIPDPFKYRVVDYDDENALGCIYLMSLCDKHIVNNAVVSFWGAYLDQNNEHTVFAPKKNQNKLGGMLRFPYKWKLL